MKKLLQTLIIILISVSFNKKISAQLTWDSELIYTFSSSITSSPFNICKTNELSFNLIISEKDKNEGFGRLGNNNEVVYVKLKLNYGFTFVNDGTLNDTAFYDDTSQVTSRIDYVQHTYEGSNTELLFKIKFNSRNSSNFYGIIADKIKIQAPNNATDADILTDVNVSHNRNLDYWDHGTYYNYNDWSNEKSIQEFNSVNPVIISPGAAVCRGTNYSYNITTSGSCGTPDSCILQQKINNVFYNKDTIEPFSSNTQNSFFPENDTIRIVGYYGATPIESPEIITNLINPTLSIVSGTPVCRGQTYNYTILTDGSCALPNSCILQQKIDGVFVGINTITTITGNQSFFFPENDTIRLVGYYGTAPKTFTFTSDEIITNMKEPQIKIVPGADVCKGEDFNYTITSENSCPPDSFILREHLSGGGYTDITTIDTDILDAHTHYFDVNKNISVVGYYGPASNIFTVQSDPIPTNLTVPSLSLTITEDEKCIGTELNYSIDSSGCPPDEKYLCINRLVGTDVVSTAIRSFKPDSLYNFELGDSVFVKGVYKKDNPRQFNIYSDTIVINKRHYKDSIKLTPDKLNCKDQNITFNITSEGCNLSNYKIFIKRNGSSWITEDNDLILNSENSSDFGDSYNFSLGDQLYLTAISTYNSGTYPDTSTIIEITNDHYLEKQTYSLSFLDKPCLGEALNYQVNPSITGDVCEANSFKLLITRGGVPIPDEPISQTGSYVFYPGDVVTLSWTFDNSTYISASPITITESNFTIPTLVNFNPGNSNTNCEYEAIGFTYNATSSCGIDSIYIMGINADGRHLILDKFLYADSTTSFTTNKLNRNINNVYLKAAIRYGVPARRKTVNSGTLSIGDQSSGSDIKFYFPDQVKFISKNILVNENTAFINLPEYTNSKNFVYIDSAGLHTSLSQKYFFNKIIDIDTNTISRYEVSNSAYLLFNSETDVTNAQEINYKFRPNENWVITGEENGNKIISVVGHKMDGRYCWDRDTMTVYVTPEEIYITGAMCSNDNDPKNINVATGPNDDGKIPYMPKGAIFNRFEVTAKGEPYPNPLTIIDDGVYSKNYVFAPADWYTWAKSENLLNGDNALFNLRTIYEYDQLNADTLLEKKEIVRFSKNVTIYKPKEDGGLLNFNLEYCPSKNSVQLSSNYQIDTITGRGVSYTASPKRFFYSFGKAYTNNIPKDSIILYYIDNNGCSYTDTSFTSINPEYAVDKAGKLFWKNGDVLNPLDDKFCLDSYDFQLATTNSYNIDTIFGPGTYKFEDNYFFNPKNVNTKQDITIYLQYTDNATACPYHSDHTIGLSSENVDNTSGLLFLNSKYCAANINYKIETLKRHGIDSIRGYGISGTNIDNINYNPFRAINPGNKSRKDLYNGTTIEDTVKVYFYDTKNCRYTKKYPVLVSGSFSNTIGELVNIKPQYCKYDETVQLIGSHEIDSIVSLGIDSTNLKWYLNPSHINFTDSSFNQTVNLKYYFKNNNKCVGSTSYTFDMNARPFAEYRFDTTRLCFEDFTVFNDISHLDGGGSITKWEWNFGDGLKSSNQLGVTDIPVNEHEGITKGTYMQPEHKYKNHGVYPVTMKVTNDKTCSHIFNDTVIIGDYPKLNFDYAGRIHNSPTIFTNNTTNPSYDQVVKYIWDFDDPAASNDVLEVATNDELYYNFAGIGVHNIHLMAISKNNCISEDSVKIPIFPYVVVDKNSNYTESFSNTESGWLPGHSYDMGLPSGWKLVPVEAPYNVLPNTSGRMWLTGDSINNIQNENSWVESPCFDISELDFPLLTLDIFQSVEAQRDGAVIQYSLNDGDDWKLLSNGASLEGGLNWYNQKGIVSNPGNQSETGNIGWSENNNEWQTARFPIDKVKEEASTENSKCVRFRIAYSSDAGNSEKVNGFAFDNFIISSRTRVVMIEQFINSAWDKAVQKAEEEWLDTLMEHNKLELVDMRYHTNISHKIDPLYEINRPDISARSFECGGTQAQLTMIDGIHRCLAPAEESVRKFYNIRSLKDKRFNISVRTEKVGDSLVITADVIKLTDTLLTKPGSQKSGIRMAIVQKEYNYEGEIFKNVMIELLPNGMGNVVDYMPADFPKGKTFTATAAWKPSLNTTTIGNKFRLVVYVQGIWGVDEVHQVWFTDLDDSLVPQQEGWPLSVDGRDLMDSGLNIYPMPARDKLTIQWDKELNNPINWEISSISGIIVKQGVISSGNTKEEIDVNDLMDGFYLLVLKDLTKSKVQKRKIMIIK